MEDRIKALLKLNQIFLAGIAVPEAIKIRRERTESCFDPRSSREVSQELAMLDVLEKFSQGEISAEEFKDYHCDLSSQC